MKNVIYNMDCFAGLQGMGKGTVDCVLTSPPYNTAGRVVYWSNKIVDGKRVYKKEKRYDKHVDNKSDEEYTQWTIDLFNLFDRVLKKDGVILYNISYGNETPDLMWCLIAEIIKKTSFRVADCIVWKKKSAVPNSTSKNKLTRICEFVFVFSRKSEFLTFNTNKRVKTTTQTGQNFYEVFYNFVEAKNNDGSVSLNKATYSTELCDKLINMYVKDGGLVLDPFMGTGTTAVACLKCGRSYIGYEISKEQCDYAEKRISETAYQPSFLGAT